MAVSLRSKVILGGRWLSGSTAITTGVGFLQTIALSRLLTPHDFGLATILWVFIGFAQMFADAGMSTATVQRREVSRNQLSTVHWTNVGIALLMAGLCCLSIPFWVGYYREPALAQLVPWASLTLVITAFCQQFQAVAQRNLHFPRLAIGDTLVAVSGFLFSVTLAALGAGVYALVIGALVSSSVKAIWLCVSGWNLWHPLWHWRTGDLDGFLRFSKYQFGDRITNYAWNNADYVIIGHVLGSEVLGYYRLAFETVVRPLATVNPILNTILFPVFAAKQSDDAALRAGFLEMIRFITSVVAPIMVGLCVTAPWVVPALFGSQWMPVVPLLQLMSPLGLMRALLNPSAQINIAKGRIEAAFYLNLTLACVLTLGFWFSAAFGLITVAVTQVLLLSVVMIAAWVPLHRMTFGLDAKDYLASVGKPLVLSLVMGGSVFTLSRLAPVNWGATLMMSVLFIIGVIVHLTLLRIFDWKYCRQMVRLVRNEP